MFVSIQFLIFLAITLITYGLVPTKYRKYVLLIASYIWLIDINLYSAIVLGVTSILTYVFGRKIGDTPSRANDKDTSSGTTDLTQDKKSANTSGKKWFTAGVTILIASLAVFKYAGSLGAALSISTAAASATATALSAATTAAASAATTATTAAGLPVDRFLTSIVMPIGFSFYVFQSIAYLSDIYHERMEAEKDFAALALSLAFFPKLVSGPIERNRTLLPQIRNLPNVRLRDSERVSCAFAYLLYGYFMKMVLADQLGPAVDVIFADPAQFDVIFLIGGILMYTLQIYFDFAGYSYIAIGCALLFGIQLSENFRHPYLATSIPDFWRRWHMSLSSWFRDYLYIPLGGNRKGKIRKYGNIMLVFFVCGLWHGTGMTFVIWGLLHGIYNVIDNFLPKKKHVLLTFVEVSFAWLFFRASSMQNIADYFAAIAAGGIRILDTGKMLTLMGLTPIKAGTTLLFILIILISDIISEKTKITFPVWIHDHSYFARYLFFYLAAVGIFIFGVYGPGYQAEQFIYMQF